MSFVNCLCSLYSFLTCPLCLSGSFFPLPFSSSYMNHSTFRVAGLFSRWIMAWIEEEIRITWAFPEAPGGCFILCLSSPACMLSSFSPDSCRPYGLKPARLLSVGFSRQEYLEWVNLPHNACLKRSGTKAHFESSQHGRGPPPKLCPPTQSSHLLCWAHSAGAERGVGSWLDN